MVTTEKKTTMTKMSDESGHFVIGSSLTPAVIFHDGDPATEIGRLELREGLVHFEGHLGKSAVALNDFIATQRSKVLAADDAPTLFNIRFDDHHQFEMRIQGGNVECLGVPQDRGAALFFEAVAEVRRRHGI